MVPKPFRWHSILGKEHTLLQQLLLWTFVALGFVLFEEYPRHLSGPEATCYILQQLVIMIVISNTYCYLVLPFFKQRKIAIGLLLYVLLYPSLSYVLPLLCEAIAQFFQLFYVIENKSIWSFHDMLMNVFIITLIASAFNLARDRFLLDQENKEAELKQLKEQLNPHFLFNTLNNLYGLAVLKSDELPHLMLKLSELLRYSLYETNHELVPLEKEISYLKNYLDLEKIRLGDRTTVVLNLAGDFSNKLIAPMILIVFVENSIKHHTAKRKEKGHVLIDISLQGDTLSMHVKNSLDPSYSTPAPLRKTGGIGLRNVRKRLDLIYAQMHSLAVVHESAAYQLDLKINLRR